MSEENISFFTSEDIPKPLFFNYEPQMRAGVALCYEVGKRGSSRNVLVFGLPGAGKSTFPFALTNRTKKELHMDFSLGLIDCGYILARGRRAVDVGQISRVIDLVYKYRPSVLVLDEIDAIASALVAPGLAEFFYFFRRLFENLHPGLLLIGIAQNPRHVNESIVRSFHSLIYFGPVNSKMLEEMIRLSLGREDYAEIASRVWQAFKDRGFIPEGSSIIKACDDIRLSFELLEKPKRRPFSTDEIVKMLLSSSPIGIGNIQVKDFEVENNKYIRLSNQHNIPDLVSIYNEIIKGDSRRATP
jgi:hypothetical protein